MHDCCSLCCRFPDKVTDIILCRTRGKLWPGSDVLTIVPFNQISFELLPRNSSVAVWCEDRGKDRHSKPLSHTHTHHVLKQNDCGAWEMCNTDPLPPYFAFLFRQAILDWQTAGQSLIIDKLLRQGGKSIKARACHILAIAVLLLWVMMFA